jgi:hypothetical protein
VDRKPTARKRTTANQHRKALKKSKPERDRLRALKHLRYTAESRVELAIETAAGALADRKYPSPGRDRKSAFVDEYRDLTHKVIAAAEGIAAQAAGFDSWNEFQKAR